MYPKDLRYSSEHEWVRVEGGRVRVGITRFAADRLTDVVFVELPAVGAKVTFMQPFGVVESVKAVSDLYAPLSGTVVEVNPALVDSPEVVNSDPYGKGWMIVVQPDDLRELERLMPVDQYLVAIGEGAPCPRGAEAATSPPAWSGERSTNTFRPPMPSGRRCSGPSAPHRWKSCSPISPPESAWIAPCACHRPSAIRS